MPSQEKHTLIQRPTGTLYGAGAVTSGWVAVPPGTTTITIQNKVYATPGGTSPTVTTTVVESLDQTNTRTVEAWSTINSASTTQNSYTVAAPNQYASGVPAKYVSMPYIQVKLTFANVDNTFDAEVIISFI